MIIKEYKIYSLNHLVFKDIDLMVINLGIKT